MAAAAVQVLLPGGPLTETLAALWVILVFTVGVRQTLLIVDNQGLRVGLEQRVREQTADLRDMARQTEVLLDSVGDGIYAVDLDGNITSCNPSTAQAIGCDPAQLIGRNAHEVLHVAGAADASGAAVAPHTWSACYIHRALADAEVARDSEDVYRRTDGAFFPVELTATPMLNEERVTGAVVVFRDVTQRREIERMKDEFLSTVSHELRTPLTSMLGSLGMLGHLVETSPTQAQRMITIALRSCDRLIRLINDILDVERIRSGKIRMERTPLEVRTLLASTVREMGALAEANGIALHVGAADGWAVADADRITQTLTNIVGNALKFAPPGTTVRLSAIAGDSEVIFSVADEGRGIPHEKLAAIFEPFEQVDSSDSREKGGTGIGLAICRGIVERHGGRIWAESELGEGSTVHFTVPRAFVVPQPADAAGSTIAAERQSCRRRDLWPYRRCLKPVQPVSLMSDLLSRPSKSCPICYDNVVRTRMEDLVTTTSTLVPADSGRCARRTLPRTADSSAQHDHQDRGCGRRRDRTALLRALPRDVRRAGGPCGQPPSAAS